MKTPKQKIGTLGEDYAARFLKERGYSIVDRNFRRPWGELDMVAKKDGALVFCEVKSLRALTAEQADRGMRPEDQMSYHKLRRFKKAILLYLKENRLPFDQSWRADVIAIELDTQGKLFDIRHVENIIFPE
ncbi:MAG: YraN family protein [Parcubacteria group bacterium]|nr:YraN family protein [Parcubacteria group bacterium]